jgi:putative flavoprotein involved in K+ transport
MKHAELIIIGSGPAGLQAGQLAQKRGIDYIILEKGDVAHAWREIRPSMPMLSPNHPQRDWTSISAEFPIWRLNVSRPYCSAAEFVYYLQEFSDHFALNIATHTVVKQVIRKPDGFDVVTDQGTYSAPVIYNATGFFGNPFIPRIPGLRKNRIVTHSHAYQSSSAFNNKRVLVIGAGNSGAEIAIDLVGFSQVFLMTRRPMQFFSKTKNLCHIRGISESYLLELIAMELIRYIPDAQIKRVDGDVVHYNDTNLKVDAIICATGYRASIDHLGDLPLGIHAKTKFPLTTENGAAEGIDDFYFGGPLLYRRLGSLFIHGFIKYAEDTIDAIEKRLKQRVQVMV